jgi:hypothetical protein
MSTCAMVPEIRNIFFRYSDLTSYTGAELACFSSAATAMSTIERLFQLHKHEEILSSMVPTFHS